MIKPMPIRRAVPLAQPAPKSTAMPRSFPQLSRFQGFDIATSDLGGTGGYVQRGSTADSTSRELYRQDLGEEEEYWEDGPGWSAGGAGNQQGGRGGTSWEDALMAHDGAQCDSTALLLLASRLSRADLTWPWTAAALRPRAGPSSSRPLDNNAHEDVQYLEDVEAALGRPSQPSAVSGTIRAQKKGIKLRPVSELRRFRRFLLAVERALTPHPHS